MDAMIIDIIRLQRQLHDDGIAEDWHDTLLSNLIILCEEAGKFVVTVGVCDRDCSMAEEQEAREVITPKTGE